MPLWSVFNQARLYLYNWGTYTYWITSSIAKTWHVISLIACVLLTYSCLCLFLYQICWLKAFEAFEDKTSAINPDTGVNEQLARMITDCIKPDQKLAVGSHEYKEIIEKTMVSMSSLFCLCRLWTILSTNFTADFFRKYLACMIVLWWRLCGAWRIACTIMCLPSWLRMIAPSWVKEWKGSWINIALTTNQRLWAHHLISHICLMWSALCCSLSCTVTLHVHITSWISLAKVFWWNIFILLLFLFW